MTNNRQFSAKPKAEPEALQELPDDQIDTSDIPELLDWTGARRGVFYGLTKLQVPLGQHGKDYEERDDQETDLDTDRA